MKGKSFVNALHELSNLEIKEKEKRALHAVNGELVVFEKNRKFLL